MTLNQVIVLSLVLAPLVFLAIILALRQSAKNVKAAIVAAIIFGIANLLVDMLAHRVGWWSYPVTGKSYAPIAFYVVAGLVFGGGLALIGRWAREKHDKKGLLAFLVVAPILGLAWHFKATQGWSPLLAEPALVWGKGWSVFLADYLAWLILVILCQVIMRSMLGRPPVDRAQSARPSRPGPHGHWTRPYHR